MAETGRGESLLEIVRRTMEADEWPVHQLPGQNVLSSAVSADSLEWSLYAVTFEETEQVAIYSAIPINVPEERRLAAAELITRANYGLRLGNFELDFSDGELRFKTSIDVEGEAWRRVRYATCSTPMSRSPRCTCPPSPRSSGFRWHPPTPSSKSRSSA